MQTKAPVRHGTDAGYRAELETDSVCDRCRKAHSMYERSTRKQRKGQGKAFSRTEVIDHLWTPAKRGKTTATAQPSPAPTTQQPYSSRTAEQVTPGPSPAIPSPAEAEGGSPSAAGPSMRDRMTGILGKIQSGANPYVESDAAPDYLHSVEPDPDPMGDDWAEVKPDEFVVTKQHMERIQDNMGTYLSVVSMTLSLADPYCAPNDDEIDELVKRWSKVIARYPRAAKFFMSEGGGALMDWIGAATATWPILIRLYEHHLSHEIKTDKGQVYRVHPSANGQPVDATMPPVPDTYDYSVG